MRQKIWTERYKIASYLVNLRGKAGLYGILNLIQDVGWNHAFHLQIRLSEDQGWVFTRQHIVMHEWPSWNETVTIRTWLRPPIDPFGFRDYELFIGDRKIGEGTSTFSIMDMRTRKIVRGAWDQFTDVWCTEPRVNLNPGKIPLLEEKNLKTLARFEVRNSDIDMNQHVNNTKYAKWILDAVSLEVLRGGITLHEYEVNFLAEAKSGDVVSIQEAVHEPLVGSAVIQYQGVRVSDSKPVFSARLHVSCDEQLEV